MTSSKDGGHKLIDMSPSPNGTWEVAKVTEVKESREPLPHREPPKSRRRRSSRSSGATADKYQGEDADRAAAVAEERCDASDFRDDSDLVATPTFPLCLCGAPATIAAKIERFVTIPMCQRCAVAGQIGVNLLKRFL